MSSELLLNYDPPELNFLLDQNRQLSSSVRLLNKTDDYVAFKLKSTNPRNYVVRPRIGILLPRSTCEIKVTTRAPREAHHNMRCKDKFMIESVATSPATTLEDARKLFDKDAGHPCQEFILRVVHSRQTESPPGTSVNENTVLAVHNRQTEPLPGTSVTENAELAVHSRPTESSPGTSVAENTDTPAPEVNNFVAEPPDNGLQVTTSVTEPHNNDTQVANHVTEPRDKDSKEVNNIRNWESILRGFISNWTGESILREAIGVLLGLLSLYLMKQTLSWIWSLVMFVVMVMFKMIKKLVSDSVEDWIVKTLLHIVMYILFGRRDNTGLT